MHVCAQVCGCRCGHCLGGADGCIFLTMLVDVLSVLLFAYVCMLTAFETLSLL